MTLCRSLLTFCLGILVGVHSSLGRADTEIRPLRYDLRWDVPVAVAAGLGWLGSEVFKKSLVPASCRWCERDASGASTVNGLDAGVRSALKWAGTSTTADVLSGVSAYAVVPLVSLGGTAWAGWAEGPAQERLIDALIIAEAVMVGSSFNQIVKFIVGRERPFANALTDAEKAAIVDRSDHNLSFYSAHTGFAFAAAVSAGTVAKLRGYSCANWVLGGGLAVAAITGYLRMAADKHYLTDVLTGAVMGSAFGFAVPYFFHRPSESGPTLSVIPSATEPAIQVSWSW